MELKYDNEFKVLHEMLLQRNYIKCNKENKNLQNNLLLHFK